MCHFLYCPTLQIVTVTIVHLYLRFVCLGAQVHTNYDTFVPTQDADTYELKYTCTTQCVLVTVVQGGTGGYSCTIVQVYQGAGNLQLYLKHQLPYHTGGRGSILRIAGTTT